MYEPDRAMVLGAIRDLYAGTFEDILYRINERRGQRADQARFISVPAMRVVLNGLLSDGLVVQDGNEYLLATVVVPKQPPPPRRRRQAPWWR